MLTTKYEKEGSTRIRKVKWKNDKKDEEIFWEELRDKDISLFQEAIHGMEQWSSHMS